MTDAGKDHQRMPNALRERLLGNRIHAVSKYPTYHMVLLIISNYLLRTEGKATFSPGGNVVDPFIKEVIKFHTIKYRQMDTQCLLMDAVGSTPSPVEYPDQKCLT